MSFHSLGLIEQLLRALRDRDYRDPTPIQQRAIPVILAGRDLLASAQTGTGKTATFLLPILQRLTTNIPDELAHGKIRSLVLTPTRELAIQVNESAQAYAGYLPLSSTAIYGGVSIKGQISSLRRGCELVVATPGRLLDHLSQNTIDVSAVETLVLDEADRMLDLGFLPDIRKIIAQLPKKRQNLMFSATFPEPIVLLARQLLHNPAEVSIAPAQTTADGITERVYGIRREHKPELLSYLIGSGNWKQVLVFVRTQHGADRLEKQLIRNGIRASSLHGDKSQSARSKALALFKSGAVNCLVATDIAARGLDIEQLPFVVNFDLPLKAEDYIHRIGRTGRAGFTGEAIALACPEEAHLLRAIEILLKRKIPRVADTGYEPVSLNMGDSPNGKHAKIQAGKRPAKPAHKTYKGQNRNLFQQPMRKKSNRQSVSRKP